jgi:hypothetical protein
MTRRHEGISQTSSRYGTSLNTDTREGNKIGLHLASNAGYISCVDWYYNFEYPLEMKRGYDPMRTVSIPVTFRELVHENMRSL